MSNSPLRCSGMACANEGSHSFTCHPHVYPHVEWTIPALTPQPQSVTTLWPVLVFCPTEGRWLSWPDWLVTNRGGLPACRWSPIRHPSTNQTWCRITSLIEINELPRGQAWCVHEYCSKSADILCLCRSKLSVHWLEFVQWLWSHCSRLCWRFVYVTVSWLPLEFCDLCQLFSYCQLSSTGNRWRKQSSGSSNAFMFMWKVDVVVEFCDVAFCLQCFDAVGWVAGRASSL